MDDVFGTHRSHTGLPMIPGFPSTEDPKNERRPVGSCELRCSSLHVAHRTLPRCRSQYRKRESPPKLGATRAYDTATGTEAACGAQRAATNTSAHMSRQAVAHSSGLPC